MKKLFYLIFNLSIISSLTAQVNFYNNTFYNTNFSSATGFNNLTGVSGGASVWYTLASGASNKVLAGSHSSQVFGDNSTVGGYASMAAGSFTKASADNSFAIGQWVTASATHSVVIGTGRWSSTPYASNFTNNFANSLMVSFNNTTTAPTDPSLFVGPIGTYNGYTYSLGCVGIGTTNTKGYLFAVNGSMIATKIKVATYANWPDYVFEKNYPLLPLNKVAEFINKNHHLPGIESASAITNDGYDVADMDAKLLKQVEEMYLHAIQLEKENKALSEKVKLLEEKLKR
ncbi:MAG: hypothetical protein WAQ28_10860 [Bacteroidia bacterium]|jgi:hypothetical protein